MANLSDLLARQRPLKRITRTSNVALAVTDQGKWIDITSGTFTQTITAAATLGADWWCYLGNSGDGDVTLDPNGSETVDGLTSFVMYPGELRLLVCTGSGFETMVLSAFRKIFTADATFIKPPGYRAFFAEMWGGGGSGAAGNDGGRNATGGTGGAYWEQFFGAETLGATESVDIGSGGASQSVGMGGDGAPTIFGGITVPGGVGGTWAEAGNAISGAQGGELTGAPSIYRGGDNGAVSSGNVPSAAEAVTFGGGAGGSRGGSSNGNPGTSVFGGDGGAAAAGSGGAGSPPGGGGGGVGSGSNSGAGARGELRLTGIV